MTRPSEYIESMVCGLPFPERSDRLLLMLNCYIDDSNVGTGPAYVLAGWVASAEKWRGFSDAWREALWMKPRIDYFKYSDAMNFNGPFNGLSEESRDLKIKILIGLIEEYDLLGICSVIERKIFNHLWAVCGDPLFRNPYVHSFYGIIARLMAHQALNNQSEEIQFVFDNQDAQMPRIMEGWNTFIKGFAPDHQKLLAGPPHFADDKKVVALQAADLHAGWRRELQDAGLARAPIPKPIWGDRGKNLKMIHWVMDEYMSAYLFQKVFGMTPIRVTYTYGYGLFR